MLGRDMPRHANYTEGSRTDDETDRTAPNTSYNIDLDNPFDDPEVRQRMAELIARSVRPQKSRS
jgi:hypothetical protein